MKKNKIVNTLFVLIAALSIPAWAEKLDMSEALPKNLFIELGRRVNPAVVNISTTQILHSGRGNSGGFGYPGMPMPNDPFRQFFEEFMGPQGGGQQAPEEKVQSLGSGFIIDSAGLIITNNHVIQGASDIQVQLIEGSKKTYKAKVVGADKRTDVALIKITAEKPLPFVGLGDSDKVEVGEWVAAFGNPFGHGHSMTKGIISAKDRFIELENASYAFLQTDASINPGNSGGPLVNSSGDVIGVNSAIDARAQGIGFAIPVNIVKKLLPQLKTKGRIIHGYLGVGINTIDDRMVKEFKLKSDQGVIVLKIEPGSPAARAGLHEYDIITAVNGKEVNDARDLTNTVAETAVGNSLTLSVIRDGKSLTIKAKVAERPDEIAQGGPGDSDDDDRGPRGLNAPFNLGMSLADLTPQVARQLEMQDGPARGVVIVSVKQNGLADQAGLQVGDVILDVNRHPIRTAKEANKVLKHGTNSLRILRGTATLIVFMETK